jgi:two-component system, chemotaxis family, sensor kinase Cph1
MNVVGAKTDTTLTHACESEQLHLSGAIQAFGALLRLDAITLKVTHASANLQTFIGIPATQILGRSIDEIGWISRKDLANLPAELGKTYSHPHIINLAKSRIDALLIRSVDSIVIEIERNNTVAEPSSIQQYQRPLMTVPRNPDELREYHTTLLQAFRTLTGYHRVMVYQFHEDWVGEVTAEIAPAGMGSYLGLRFPDSDIPEIARKLYLINPSRMIPDAKSVSIPVLGIDDAPPDLTWSNLRSVSPVHLQYLANMGVGASFSVPIRVAGKLWGLIACHNLVPRVLSPDQRNACAVLTDTFALGLTSYISSRRLQSLDSMERRIDRVLELIADYANPLDGIEANSQTIINSLSANGFAMAIDNDVVIAGHGPDMDGLALIDDWFLNNCRENMFSTDHLSGTIPSEQSSLSTISGLMAIKVRSARTGWIRFYWFLTMEVQEVSWAGNPNKPVTENTGAATLSPRRSFERWVETKTGFSRSWTNEEKIAASKFRSNLLRWL